MSFLKEIDELSDTATALIKAKAASQKQKILLQCERVRKALEKKFFEPFFPFCPDIFSKNILYSLTVIDQGHVLSLLPDKNFVSKFRQLMKTLKELDHFFQNLGGLIGYQLQILKFLSQEALSDEEALFSIPPKVDLADGAVKPKKYLWNGLEAIDEIAEIYPIGGLGSRLDLKDAYGEPLPAALLNFVGRSLLEGLIRDVQAREFCFFRLYGKQVMTPIAMMASEEKKNKKRIFRLCAKKNWFGRGKKNFTIFSQLSVPVVTKEGKWALKKPLELHMQPGGHGAMWRTAEEKKIFEWFLNRGKKRLLVRQINNPIAGLDHNILSMVGAGKSLKKVFGFASCDRMENAAEGALVLMEKEGRKKLSNIEYTDFHKKGMAIDLKNYPANTNILYADLEKLLPRIRKNPHPGLMLNMKNQVSIWDASGEHIVKDAGRLESMMQSICETIVSKKGNNPLTFLTYNTRKKTISTAKKKFENDLLETPEGAFYDLLFNAHELLEKHCGINLPPFCKPAEFLKNGPSTLFLYHPALGPLYEIISQKLQGGNFHEKSELQLEITDVFIRNLDLQGSLVIEAENILGHYVDNQCCYSQKTGKCILQNVKVKNAGVRERGAASFRKNAIKRKEALKIFLEGNAEFFARDVLFTKNHTFRVPNDVRLVVRQGKGGNLIFKEEKPGWKFSYVRKDNKILLKRDLQAGK